MAPGCAIRSAEDVEVAALTYSEVKAIATGNVLFLRKAELDSQVARLSLRKREHGNRKMRAKFELARADQIIGSANSTLESLRADDLQRRQWATQSGQMEISGKLIEDRDRFDSLIDQIKVNASSWPLTSFRGKSSGGSEVLISY
jgi:hypothetical protein